MLYQFNNIRNYSTEEKVENKQSSLDSKAMGSLKKFKISTSELESIYQKFIKKADDDHLLNENEFSNALTSVGIKDPLLIKNYFNAFDLNKDGTVDFKEFATGLATITKGETEEKVDFLFKVWDQNNDGTISKEEFLKYFQISSASDKLAKGIGEQIWNNIDLDNNGRISKEEFKRAILMSKLVSPKFPLEESEDTHFKKEERELLALVGERVTLKTGDRIAYNTLDTAFYYLLKGQVNLEIHGNTVEEIATPGIVFGEEALLTCPRITDAVVVNDAEVIKLDVQTILPLIYHSHPSAVGLIEQIGETLMKRMRTIENFIFNDSVISKNKEQITGFIENKNKLSSQWSLLYHSLGVKGKISIKETKQIGTVESLSVAYSPGVAEPCLVIKENPEKAYEYTSKGHLVGVVSNGTAVLGLGNIGALASKPVMEGKAVLFRKFAGLDSFDIELNAPSPDAFIEHCVALEPTFGGINIEDVKAPECFFIEKEVQKRVSIPIMHDDQHGTAIIAGAGLLNALELVQKDIKDIKVVICGVGAAGFTCAKYFISLGVRPENLIPVDKDGVVFVGRPDLKGENQYLNKIATTDTRRKLSEVIVGADVFLGVSAGNLLKPEMLASMAPNPLVFALANPTPEISYNLARQTRKDVIVATGRSDFPNQINNVCAFPYIFRGALDVQAKEINEPIKRAATNAIAKLAKLESPEIPFKFGPDYIIPKPFDKRLLWHVSSAVAQAAITSGVARKQLDIERYTDMLKYFSEKYN